MTCPHVPAGPNRQTLLAAAGNDHTPRYVDFLGEHQNGVTAMPVPALASVSAFRVSASDRDELAEMFTELSASIADAMAGRVPGVRDPAYPPAQTGILGPEPPPDDLAIVVGVGVPV